MFQPIPPRRLLTWAATALVISALSSSSISQTVSRASVSSQGAQANHHSVSSSISADGRVVVFTSSASDLVPGDTNGARDVFVRDLAAGTTERVSVGPGGLEGNGDSISYGAVPSADGRFVPFHSAASNLVPGDANAGYDVFVHDRQTGTTEIVSVNSVGVYGNGESAFPSISADGRYVAFGGGGTNLVVGDANGLDDMFVRDRQTGTTERVSIAIVGEPNGLSWLGRISADGRYVGYASFATNLVHNDKNSVLDSFLYDRTSATTTRVSVSASGVEGNARSDTPAVSADGRFVVFKSRASNFVSGDSNLGNDVFVKDMQSGELEVASVSTSGVLHHGEMYSEPTISADGRFVCFDSTAWNLDDIGQHDRWGGSDIFLRDRHAGSTVRISVHSSGEPLLRASSEGTSISADGRFLAFTSDCSTLVPQDTNALYDVFVRDLGRLPESFCHTGPCPCVDGEAGHGCGHSAAAVGAILTGAGQSSLFSDHLELISSLQPPAATLSILLQGTAQIPAVNYGDGLRCVGGSLGRLYAHGVSGWVTEYPGDGEASIAARSATLGDPIAAGSTRFYQAYFRDSSPTFCPPPTGSTWNATNALGILWTP